MKDIDWEKKATRLLKTALVRKGWKIVHLHEALQREGAIKSSQTSLRATIRKGRFRFAFLLQCADVLGLETMELFEDE